MCKRASDFRPLSSKVNDQRTERHGPDYAMQQYFGWRYCRNDLEINGQETPERVGNQAGDDPIARIGHRSASGAGDSARFSDSCSPCGCRPIMARNRAAASSCNMYNDGIRNSVMIVAKIIP